MLNHSCTRCRSKKLRCDGSSPCSNCRAKGISHVCQRAQRKERPRKSAVAATTVTKRYSPPGSSSSTLVDEVSVGASLAKLHVRTETERSTVTATSRPESESARSPLSSSSSSSSKPPPPPVVHFSPAPPHFRGCLVTPKIIADAREYIGALHPALRLINYVFQWRCQSMAHSCVNLPTIKHTLRQLFSDEWAPEIAQDQLALALMAVAMSIQFSPRRGPYAHVFQVVQALGPAMDPVERQQRIHQLARSIVQSRMLDTNTSLEGVQTIVLLLIYDLDEESFKERLWLSAVRGAQSLRLNHIQHDYSGAVPSLESELGVRVWWFLVCRDWLYALARGTYKLHPNHFTTRLPMIITDEDLAEGRTPNRQAGEVSPVSVSIPFIGLASLIRQLVDIRSERTPDEFSQDVADAFDTFVETLPHIFSLSTTHIASLDDNIFTQQRLESERWLLHQQIFHAYLHFDELRLDRPICPQMVALASHTLQLQDRVRARCHIIDSMRINVTGVLRAITVLTIDLLQKHRDSRVSLARQVTLGKIKEAIYKCEASPNLAEGDLDNVYKLIEMEESAWVAKSRSMVPRRSVFSPPTQERQGSLLTAPTLHPLSFNESGAAHNSSQTSLNEGGEVTSAGPGSYSGTASEGSVGTTSPVVDMPVVPMDLPGGVQAANHQQHPQVKTQHRDSIPSVLLSSAEHSSRVQQQIGGGGGGGMYSQQQQPQQAPHPQPQMPYHQQHPQQMAPPPQQQQQQQPAPFPSGMPGNVNGHQAHPHPQGMPPRGSYSETGFPQNHNQAYTHTHTHTHGGGFPTMPTSSSAYQQQAPPPPPGQQHLDVAQWAALVPSDQALSPIFAPDLLAAHTPSWAELYATFGA